jgi:hypothetical protein
MLASSTESATITVDGFAGSRTVQGMKGVAGLTSAISVKTGLTPL